MHFPDNEHHYFDDAVLPDVQFQGGHLQGREEEDGETAELFAAHISHQKTEERSVECSGYCRTPSKLIVQVKCQSHRFLRLHPSFSATL